MAPKEIIILGLSFSGLSTAHYFLRQLEPKLRSSPDAYHLTLIDPSTHFRWAIAAPRQMVTEDTVPFEKTFIPITDILSQYDAAKWTFTQAAATSVNFEQHLVSVKSDAGSEDIAYDYLIIATGARTPTPLTNLHGDHSLSLDALKNMQRRLKSPNISQVVVSGGGAIGVETAGEIGEALNGKPGWLFNAPQNVRITIVTSAASLLPSLPPKQGSKAESYLQAVGVDVIYKTRVTRTEQTKARTTVHLDSGSSISADVYIPATGLTPSSTFLPENLLNARGYVKTDANMHVIGAPAGVFAVGDVSSHGIGQTMPIMDSIPVLGHNLGVALGVSGLTELKVFDKSFKDTQIVPIGRSRGVGALFGWGVPSWFVAYMKGRDYLLDHVNQVTDGAKKWGKIAA